MGKNNMINNNNNNISCVTLDDADNDASVTAFICWLNNNIKQNRFISPVSLHFCLSLII